MSKKKKNITAEEAELNNNIGSAVEETEQTKETSPNESQEALEQDPQEEKTEEEEIKESIEEWKEKYIRLYAEFENYKKRTLKEKAELILNGSEKTIVAILPILDDFERAVADKTEDAGAIKEGFELIFKKFLKTLENLGVNKIETEDKDFNVDYHEAIAMVPGVENEKKGKIVDCVQTGYTLNDKVIRHSKVAVGQ